MRKGWETGRGGDLLGPMTLVLSRVVVASGESDDHWDGGGDGGGEGCRDDPWQEAQSKRKGPQKRKRKAATRFVFSASNKAKYTVGF